MGWKKIRRVEGKIAIITGSTYGIGEAIAKIPRYLPGGASFHCLRQDPG